MPTSAALQVHFRHSFPFLWTAPPCLACRPAVQRFQDIALRSTTVTCGNCCSMCYVYRDLELLSAQQQALVLLTLKPLIKFSYLLAHSGQHVGSPHWMRDQLSALADHDPIPVREHPEFLKYGNCDPDVGELAAYECAMALLMSCSICSLR